MAKIPAMLIISLMSISIGLIFLYGAVFMGFTKTSFILGGWLGNWIESFLPASTNSRQEEASPSS
jgi:hypothetical protein